MRPLLTRLALLTALVAAGLVAPDPAPAQERARAARGGDDGLKTKNGAWLKLIVKQNASVYDQPDRSATARPIRQFDFLYAVPAATGGTEKLRDGFYHVAAAPRTDQSMGWISEGDVIEWPHRQALLLRPLDHGEPSLTFFRTRADLEAAHAGKTVAPLAQGHAAAFGLLAIRSATKIRLDSGDQLTAFEVASIPLRAPEGAKAGDDKAGNASDTDAKSADGRRKGGETEAAAGPARDMTLDIAFVIEATPDMKPWVAATLKALRILARTLAADPAQEARVRMGLFGYRGSGAGPDAERLCDFNEALSLDTFLGRLAAIKLRGDGPCSVLEGLALAIHDKTWNELSYKNLILIGQAPANLDPEAAGGLTIERVLAAAQPPAAGYGAITVHAFQCGRASSKEATTARDQFRTLATGRSLPGKHVNVRRPEDLTDRLVAFLADRTRYVMAAGGRAMPSRVLIPATADAGSAPGGFASGFIAEYDPRGRHLVESCVLVGRARLEKGIAVLNLLQSVLENAQGPASIDRRRLMTNVRALGLELCLDQDFIGEPAARDAGDKLRTIAMGLPIPYRPGGANAKDDGPMDEKELLKLSQRLLEVKTTIDRVLADPDAWFTLNPGDESKDRFTMIRISELP